MIYAKSGGTNQLVLQKLTYSIVKNLAGSLLSLCFYISFSLLLLSLCLTLSDVEPEPPNKVVIHRFMTQTIWDEKYYFKPLNFRVVSYMLQPFLHEPKIILCNEMNMTNSTLHLLFKEIKRNTWSKIIPPPPHFPQGRWEAGEQNC